MCDWVSDTFHIRSPCVRSPLSTAAADMVCFSMCVSVCVCLCLCVCVCGQGRCHVLTAQRENGNISFCGQGFRRSLTPGRVDLYRSTGQFVLLHEDSRISEGQSHTNKHRMTS